MARIKSISEVVSWQLCTGCGACAAVEPARFVMADTLDLGRRPFLREDARPESGDGLAVCPGRALRQINPMPGSGVIDELHPAWGPVLEVWEGYAADSEIRFCGSSGGAASALALHSIERANMQGALHVGARHDVPYLNETVFSSNRADLLARTGSRYAPASPCDGLSRIEEADAPCVFIGKPCDVAAAGMAAAIRPQLRARLGLSVAFFCAGAPSVEGTLALMKKVGINDPSNVRSLRYRGQGWPGRWIARYVGGRDDQEKTLSYGESWGFLQRYRPWRCHVCPDHSGEFADIAVGDPWYRAVTEGEAGRSLIVARTARGRDAVLAAARDGYLILERSDPTLLPRSQPNLLSSRGALWGRLLTLRILGAPVPEFSGFPMFRYWWSALSWWPKVQSFAGTARRVFKKGLRKRIVAQIWLPRG